MNTISNIDYHIILSNRNMIHYGEIQNIDQDSIGINDNFNSADELSFTVYKNLDGKECSLWDKIVDLKLVYVVERDEYFQIECPITDSDAISKSVTGTSLCEAELGQININGTYINTEEDIARDDYIPTVFCNPIKPEGSLLHRILKSAPHYSIGHVDESLMNLQRSFSIDGTSIYEFFTGDCADQFNCIFIFDTTTRTVNAYDLYTVCNKCGHRGEYNDVCPECGSTDLKYLGEDTTITVSKNNLTDEISYSTDVDSIKNCFKLVAGDDDMTAAVINNNPNGSAYIWMLSDFQKEDMSEILKSRLDSYDKLYTQKQPEYSKLTENIYECIDKIGYYTSSMMPDIKHAEITASTEAKKLTNATLSPLGLSSVTTSTSIATIESALKNYAKVFIKQGYVKLEVVDGASYNRDFSYEGTDKDGNHYGYWKGRIKITNYSDEDDVAYSSDLNIKVYDLYQDFLQQKIDKLIAKENDDEGSIYDVLSIKVYKSDGKTEDTNATLTKFKEVLTLYSLNRLKSFYDALQGCIDIMVQEDQASEMADLYQTMYVPFKNKLDACQSEMDKRQATIDSWQQKYDSYDKQRSTIQKQLNFENYLGTKLFLEFSAYRRDDTYSNDNFISDGLDNSELFKKANEFLEAAKKEIQKACEPQHTISASLYNLLKIDAFKPLVNHFKVGNWIRFIVDNKVYRLRLIKIGYDNSDESKIITEFSNLTVVPDIQSDVKSVLSSAQSMSTTYSYVVKQAEQGNKAQDTLSDMQRNGLNSALYAIQNADTQEVTYGKYGLLCRKYDDITNTYSKEQFKITNNLMVYTDDGWQSARSALGKHTYVLNGESTTGYGLNCDFMISGTMVGGHIYSLNYKTDDGGHTTEGTHIDLKTGEFDFAGGKLTYNPRLDKLELTGTINGSRIEGGSLLIGNKKGNTYAEIDEDGKMIVRGITIIDGTYEVGNQGNSFVGATIKNSTITGSTFSTSNATGYYSTKVGEDGALTASGADISGTITSTKGTIAGLTISEDSLYHNLNVSSGGMSASNDGIFWAGSLLRDKATAPFRVKNNGDLYTQKLYLYNSSVKNNYTGNTSTIEGYNSSGKKTINISNESGEITVYDSSNANPAVFSSTELNLSATNSKLVVKGTKSRISDTDNYNERLLYCYETSTPMFGDIGSGEIGDTGECLIYIDPVFAETINTNNCEYYVFLSPYGKGELYVSERTANYFIVSGTPNLQFAWEMKAKQKDFEMLRLDEYTRKDDLL